MLSGIKQSPDLKHSTAPGLRPRLGNFWIRRFIYLHHSYSMNIEQKWKNTYVLTTPSANIFNFEKLACACEKNSESCHIIRYEYS